MYESRDYYFTVWLDTCPVKIPADPESRKYAVEAMRKAFNAGWLFRKNVVDYQHFCGENLKELGRSVPNEK